MILKPRLVGLQRVKIIPAQQTTSCPPPWLQFTLSYFGRAEFLSHVICIDQKTPDRVGFLKTDKDIEGKFVANNRPNIQFTGSKSQFQYLMWYQCGLQSELNLWNKMYLIGMQTAPTYISLTWLLRIQQIIGFVYSIMRLLKNHAANQQFNPPVVSWLSLNHFQSS